MTMSDRMYQQIVRRVLDGDRDEPTRETTTPQSIEENTHLKKRIESLEALRDVQKRTIEVLQAEIARLRAHSNG